MQRLKSTLEHADFSRRVSEIGGIKMRLQFNGTAAAEGFPAFFVSVNIVRKRGSWEEKRTHKIFLAL